jgi:4-cresol dehydrogenase (hydroxylating)
MTPAPELIPTSLFARGVRERLGSDAIDQTPETLCRIARNVGAFDRRVAGLLRAKHLDAVVALVNLAALHRVHLYPISSGRNWGLGSKLPVSPNNFVLDLSGMNRIREVNASFGWAVIEAGITQGQLSEYLRAARVPFFLDVTGSARDTSVVGNTLERGVAYNTQRSDTVRSFEVVLGTGEILHTGFAHHQNSRLSGLYRHGVGPSLDGLFFQSNLGIVTAATVALLPLPEHHETFLFSLPDESRLGALCEALRRLHDSGVARSVVHIANRRRSQSSMAPLLYEQLKRQGRQPSREQVVRILNSLMKGAWSAIGCLMGPKGMVRAARRELFRQLSPLGTLRILDARRLVWMQRICSWLGLADQRAFLLATESLLGVNRGEPTDEALRSVYWPYQTDNDRYTEVDAGEGGIRYSLPLIPMDTAAVAEAQTVLAEAERTFERPIAVTLNTLHGRCLEAVISVDFPHGDQHIVSRARTAIEYLNQEFPRRGFDLYRVDIDSMGLLPRPGDPFWDTVSRLKRTLDPYGVIAPGRYCQAHPVAQINAEDIR